MNQFSEKRFRILVADDDPTVLDLYQQILCPQKIVKSGTARQAPASYGKLLPRPSFDLTRCSQGYEAVDAVRQSVAAGSPFAVAFIDLNMPPGPDGEWTAAQIHRRDPNTNIVLVTGWTSTDRGTLPRGSAFPDKLLYLQKPFHRQEIVQFATALSTKWEAELQLNALNSEMEALIEKRTAELVNANRRLKAEIETRKQVQAQLEHSLDNQKQVIDGTIRAIAMMVEMRDPYTSGHQQRVAELALALAVELDLSSDQSEGIYMAAAIHDIGKIALPAEILSKPGKLTDIEMEMIHAHCRAGYETLMGIEFPWPIAQVVLQHHERMDGSGYPQGLTGNDILLEARIVGVADVVETMASHRPYRPSIGIDKALEEIAGKRGQLYDPAVVDACLRLFAENNFEFPQSKNTPSTRD